MPQSPKEAFELWWEDTDGGRVSAKKRRASLTSHMRDLQQAGLGVRQIARDLTERTGGRIEVSHSSVHRWMKRDEETTPVQ